MRRITVVAALLATLCSGAIARAQFPGTLAAPETVGDQAIFFFDARQNYTTFFTLRSTAFLPLNVRILLYTGNFATPFTLDVALQPQALRIIDVGALRAGGLPQLPGVAIATALDAQGRPFVTHALSGNFTVANLLTGSGWGAPAAARNALQQGSLTPAAVGTEIDGTSVFLPPIAATSADLAAYYDPNDLAPPTFGGNQLIFVSFTDVPGTSYTATPASVNWQADATDSSGTPISSNVFTATGVMVSDLATVAGAGVNGFAGSLVFRADAVTTATTRLVFFTEALGTFGTGYLLPADGALVPCCPSS